VSEPTDGLSVSTLIEGLLAVSGFLAAFLLDRITKRMEKTDDIVEKHDSKLAVHDVRIENLEDRLDKDGR
jgi:hypothetical protein